MGLGEYKRKRNFRRTAEPAGKLGKSASGRSFVIQKHAASRLHYDFRLELEGVLKSWAVPKGPSTNPADKRLAVHVEDHPIEYGSFEGIIPEGQYGGGTVMLWDRGQWEPLGENAHEDYRQGKLKFTLHGERLQGAWMLVRMGGKAAEEGNNWLLVKEKDAFASKKSNEKFLKDTASSVSTGRTMEQIAADQDAVWNSSGHAWEASKAGTVKAAVARKSGTKKPPAEARQSKAAVKAPAGARQTARTPAKRKATKRAAKASLDPADVPGARQGQQPDWLEPELATLVKAAPVGDQWLHELKFDGYRMLAVVSGGQARLMSRRSNEWTGNFREIARAVEGLPFENGILDGEVVALRPDGTTSFQSLQNALKDSRKAQLAYFLFDLPHFEGYDLTGAPLLARKELLLKLLEAGDGDGRLRYSDHIQGRGATVFEQACRHKMEGMISKRADAGYEQGRTKSWVKLKCVKRQEFVIGGYTDPSGSRSSFGALLLGYYDQGRLIYCGKVGTGFNASSLPLVFREMKKRPRATAPFVNPPTGWEARGVHYIEPELVAEVEFGEWTEDNIVRHASFEGLRQDKAAGEVVREVPEAPPGKGAARRTAPRKPARAEKAAQPARPVARTKRAPRRAPSEQEEPAATAVAGVPLSNAGKLLYPDQGITKLDLAHYYEQVEQWILPHVRKRPLSLVRCPEGPHKECWYQKHVNGPLPAGLSGVRIKEKSSTGIYLMIEDLSGLISLVQMGVLEIHPWGSRGDRIEQPDRMIFDLDPGPGVAWEQVIEAALLLRSRLGDVGLESWVKTSGGKGMHIVAPVTRGIEWDDFKAFTKALVEQLAREAPDKYVPVMTKAKRHGRIFIDYLRNGRGATAIAAYSTRARPTAAVSTPITWEELQRGVGPADFTVKNIMQRLAKLKRDPWDGFLEARQSITQRARRAVA